MQRGVSGIAAIARLQYAAWKVGSVRAAGGAIFSDTAGASGFRDRRADRPAATANDVRLQRAGWRAFPNAP